MSMLSSEEFWGCKLDSSNLKATWQYEEDDCAEHKLVVSQACLGTEAKEGERNVVNVTVTDIDGDDDIEMKTHTILSLRVGVLEQCSISIGFTSTVTFELVSGSGPVHLVGSHLLAIEDDDTSALMDGSDDESGMMDSDDSEDGPESVEDLEAMKRKIIEEDKSGKKSKVAGAGILKKSLEEVDQDSDDMDVDESDEEAAHTPSKKGKQSEKKVSFSNKVDIKTIPAKSSESGDVEKVKALILKMKTKPKTIEKLKNFVKSTHKITDPAVIADIWKSINGK